MREKKLEHRIKSENINNINNKKKLYIIRYNWKGEINSIEKFKFHYLIVICLPSLQPQVLLNLCAHTYFFSPFITV